MQFKLLALSAFAALVAADYQAILTSLATIDKDTAQLNKSVTAFDGNIFNGIPILVDSNTLNNDLKTATTNANNVSPLTSDQAIGLIGPVSNIARDSNLTLSNLIRKYPLFKQAFLTGIVASNLKDSRKASSDFSTALIAKVPASLQDAAKNIAAPIDASFGQAIAVYSQ